jgi:hypothetical protein
MKKPQRRTIIGGAAVGTIACAIIGTAMSRPDHDLHETWDRMSQTEHNAFCDAYHDEPERLDGVYWADDEDPANVDHAALLNLLAENC